MNLVSLLIQTSPDVPDKVRYLSLKPRALKARAAFRFSFSPIISFLLYMYFVKQDDITVTKFSNLIGYQDGVIGQCAPSHLSAFVFVLSLLATI